MKSSQWIRFLFGMLLLPTMLSTPLCAKAQEDEGVLISDCASGWHCDGGATYSKNSSDTTDDNACSVATFRTGFFFFLVHTNSKQGGTFDMTGAKYISMDIWVNDTDVFKNASDCRMDIGPDSNVDAWNVKIKAATLRSMELEEGWNHVYLEITGIENANYDLTKANVIRFYAIGLSDEAREIRIDNMRAVQEIPEEEKEKQPVKAQPTYYTAGESADTKLTSPAPTTRPGVIANAPQVEQQLETPPDEKSPKPSWLPALFMGVSAACAACGVVAALARGKGKRGGT